MLEGKTIHVSDVLADPEYTFGEAAEGWAVTEPCSAFRSCEKGADWRDSSLTASRCSPFTEKQIELVTTFADQAVIAIENVRLFDEVQARTRELAQSVGELQMRSAKLLKAVNSTVDLETVLTTIVARRRSCPIPMQARSMCSTR